MFWEATHIKPRLTSPPTLPSPHPWEGKLSVRGATQPPVLILHSHFRGSGSIKGNKSQLEWGGGGGGRRRRVGGGWGGEPPWRKSHHADPRPRVRSHNTLCSLHIDATIFTHNSESCQAAFLFYFFFFYTAQKSRNPQWKHCTAADRRDRWP